MLYALTRVVGGITYRQARHVLAFASAPVALSLLVLWPVRLAVYGEDVFRTGGSDHGAGNTAFVVLELLCRRLVARRYSCSACARCAGSPASNAASSSSGIA